MANLAAMLIGLERFTSGLKRHVIQIGDHRVVYSEGGHGEPLVLLHGFGASADSWNRFAKYLIRRYRVIAPDNLGWGATTRIKTAPYAYPAQLDRLHRFFSK